MTAAGQSAIGAERRRRYRQSRLRSVTNGGADVVLVRWPAQEDRRAELERLWVPRLLIISSGAMIPLSVDPLQDWIREPAEPQELEARIRQLRLRACARAAPLVDDFDVLRFGGRWLRLSAVEARLMRVLISSLGEGVERDSLMAAGWADQTPVTRNALDLHILRLRRRIAEMGLEIRTIWRHGYFLEAPRRHCVKGASGE